MKGGGVSTHSPEQLAGNPESPRSSGLLPWAGVLAGGARLLGERSRSPEPGDGCVQVNSPTDRKGVLKGEKLFIRGTQRYPKHRGGFPLENQRQRDRVCFNPVRILLWRRNFQSPPLLVFLGCFFFNKDQIDFYFTFQHKMFFFPPPMLLEPAPPLR